MERPSGFRTGGLPLLVLHLLFIQKSYPLVIEVLPKIPSTLTTPRYLL